MLAYYNTTDKPCQVFFEKFFYNFNLAPLNLLFSRVFGVFRAKSEIAKSFFRGLYTQSDHLKARNGQGAGASVEGDFAAVLLKHVADLHALGIKTERERHGVLHILIFVHAQDQIVALLCLLDRLAHHVVAIERHEREGGGDAVGVAAGCNRNERIVEEIRLLCNVGLHQRANVRNDRIHEAMLALICLGVGLGAALEERELHHAVMDIVAVFAIVEECHAVAALGEIGVFVRTDLKACRIPAGIFVRGTLNRTELDLIGCLVGVDINGECRLDHQVVLMPIGNRVKVDATERIVEPDRLGNGGILVGARDADAASCTVVDHLHVRECGERGVAIERILLPFPVVILIGVVGVDANFVACLTRSEHLASCLLVVDRDDLHGVIKDHSEKRGFHRLALDADVVFGHGCCHAGIALCGNVRHKCSLAVHRHRAACREGMGVEYHVAMLFVKTLRNACACRRSDRLTDVANDGVVDVALIVDRLDRGAGDDIMELIGEDYFPSAAEICLGEGCTEQDAIERGESLGALVEQLGPAVVALVLCDRGVGAAMVLQIELAAPRGNLPVHHALLHAAQEVANKSGSCIGDPGDALFLAFDHFDLLGGGTSAAVTVAVGDHYLVREHFLLVAIVGADHHARICGANVGTAVCGKLAQISRGQEVGIDRCAVDALPAEGVVGHGVGVVPADLGGHEPIHSRFAQDLRECGRVAEYVGEPEHAAVHAEFLAEEALAVDDLTHKALARGEVAVCLNPHRALAFPSALAYQLFDLLVEGGSLLLEVLIEQGLRGGELVGGIAAHHLHNRGEGALHLLAGLLKRPFPRTVNVCVTHTQRGCGLLGAIFSVEFLIHVCLRACDRRKEFGGADLEQIEERDGIVEVIERHGIIAAAIAEKLERLEGNVDVIPKVLHVGANVEQLDVQSLFTGNLTRVCVEVHVIVSRLVDVGVGVVGVQTLAKCSVEIDDKLRVPHDTCTATVKLDTQGHRKHFGGDVKGKAEPRVDVGLAVAPNRVGRVGDVALGGRRRVSLLVAAGANRDIGDRCFVAEALFVQNLQILRDLSVSGQHDKTSLFSGKIKKSKNTNIIVAFFDRICYNKRGQKYKFFVIEEKRGLLMREYRIEAEQAPIARTGIEFFYYDFREHKKQVSPHIHSAVELLYIRRGRFQIFADDKELRVGEGDTVLFRSNTIHRIYAQQDGDVGYYVFKFSPDFLMGLASPENRGAYLLQLALNKQDDRLVWSAEESAQNGLRAAFECLIEALEVPICAADIAMKVGATSVILSLLRDLFKGSPEANTSGFPGEEAVRRIYEVTVYLNEHYAEPISAADCAAMAYMSYSYFSRCFYRVTGKSFKEYLNATRINRAEKAILTSDKSVTEIAGDCGFNSVSYFISTYKRLKGTTPLSLRSRKG